MDKEKKSYVVVLDSNNNITTYVKNSPQNYVYNNGYYNDIIDAATLEKTLKTSKQFKSFSLNERENLYSYINTLEKNYIRGV